MNICKRFIVSGRVQGVWYRGSTQQRAKALGIKGYARNLPDGSVEVVACGHNKSVYELRSWLQQGPSNAEVSSVLTQDTNYVDLNTFETL